MSEEPPQRLPFRDGSDHPDLADIYRHVEESAGGVPNLYKVLGHAPVLLKGWIDFAWSLRADAESDRGLRELIILRVAQLSGNEYVWQSHWRAALQAGQDEKKLRALGGWQTSSLFPVEERAALSLTDEITIEASVKEETWAQFVSFFNEQHTVELVLTAAWYACVARVTASLGVPLEGRRNPAPSLSELMKSELSSNDELS